MKKRIISETPCLKTYFMINSIVNLRLSRISYQIPYLLETRKVKLNWYCVHFFRVKRQTFGLEMKGCDSAISGLPQYTYYSKFLYLNFTSLFPAAQTI